VSVLRISLFGKFDAQYGGQVVTGLDACKAQELLCYLLLYPDRPHPRETLADLLWGDTTTAQSRRYLRKALWQLQTALDSQVNLSDGRLLLAEPDWVQLNPEANLWLDVAVFEQTHRLVQGVPGSDFDPHLVQTLQDAVDLYRGDLMEGWYQDWCLYERQRLQHLYLIMLGKLMGYCEAQHDCEKGLTYGTLILRYDRARERTHRRMMRLHYLNRDRTAALRQYERCIAALHEELDVGPSRRTVTLYQQIRADLLAGPAPKLVTAKKPAEAEAPSWAEVLDRLKQLEQVLVDAQCQVQRDIQVVEQALDSQ
jgi:DNA-binding SARP family transcriptional activator